MAFITKLNLTSNSREKHCYLFCKIENASLSCVYIKPNAFWVWTFLMNLNIQFCW